MTLKSRRVQTVAGAVLVGLLLLAALWYANRPGTAPAKVGDCVTAPQGGKFEKVACGDAKAQFKVLASYSGHDGNQCDQTPDTLIPVRAGSGSSEWILCLGMRDK